MMQKKKILMIEIAGKGGICHYTYNLANALANKAKVLLVTGKNYELKDQKRRFGLLELFNRTQTNPFFILKFIRLLSNDKCSIVHFQLSQYPIFILFLCYIVKLFSDKKIVITAHNVVSHEKKQWEEQIYKKIYKIADKIIVHANANKQELLRYVELDVSKISVIPHGNYMFFNEPDNKGTNLAEKHLILFFGYIRKYKGLSVLLDALSKIKNDMPDVKLVIAGKPVEEFLPYEKKIKELELEDNVELNLTYISFEKVREYFNRASLVVLPYEKIYQSGIVQLAYAFKKPVVVTNTGGLPEVVEDGGNGYIVPVGESDMLADSITKILKDETLQARMGERSLELAMTKFSWQSIAEKTILVYKELERL